MEKQPYLFGMPQPTDTRPRATRHKGFAEADLTPNTKSVSMRELKKTVCAGNW